MTTVDEIVRVRSINPIAFIKIDCSGIRAKSLRRNARNARCKPCAVVVLEYLPSTLREYGSSPRELWTFFHCVVTAVIASPEAECSSRSR
jgi:hypothetical protein